MRWCVVIWRLGWRRWSSPVPGGVIDSHRTSSPQTGGFPCSNEVGKHDFIVRVRRFRCRFFLYSRGVAVNLGHNGRVERVHEFPTRSILGLNLPKPSNTVSPDPSPQQYARTRCIRRRRRRWRSCHWLCHQGGTLPLLAPRFRRSQAHGTRPTTTSSSTTLISLHFSAIGENSGRHAVAPSGECIAPFPLHPTTGPPTIRQLGVLRPSSSIP